MNADVMDHDSLHHVTMGDLATECQVLPASASAMEVERIFDASPLRESVVVRTAGGSCVLIARGDFYQHLTGRLGYGYALHRRRPVLEMELQAAPSFPAGMPVADAGLDLIERGEIGRARVVLVAHADGRIGTVTVQEVLAHLGRTFHRKVHALESSDRRFRSMLANASEVICLVGATGHIAWVSETVRAVLGHDPADLIGADITDRVADRDREAVAALLARVLDAPRQHVAGDAAVLDEHGDERILEFRATNLLDDPALEAIVVNIRDVTDRRRLEGRLRHDARHDSLTGLPNRAMFGEVLRAHVAVERRALAVAFIDLDGFKEVNDTLGHACGDAVLEAVAAAVRGAVRSTDLVARLGGDEFALLMLDDGAPARFRDVVDAVVARVLEAIHQPMTVAGERLVPSASIGVALSGATSDAQQLLQHADVAMYQAKAAGRNRAAWWDRAMHEAVIEHHRLARELSDAVRSEQLVLHYQPLVGLPSGRIVGYEALLRWERPGHGTVPPSEFIGVAEETKAIVRIGRWVLLQACRDAMAWDPSPDGPGVSVNLSARQFESDDVVAHVTEALVRSGLAANRLEVELTETAMMQRLESVAPRIQAVRDLGVRVAIDDFGVGYSSLAQLRGLPVDCVKIDRSFVSALSTSSGDRALVTGIIGLARALRLSVVAEGVETADQAAMVTELGCERAQGYFFARPIGSEEVGRSLRASTPDLDRARQEAYL